MSEAKWQSDEIGELAGAMAKAQAIISPALKDAQNPHLKNRYADLGSNWDACRDALTSNGLTLLQTTEDESFLNPDGSRYWTTWVVTTLAHSSGQWIRGRVRLVYEEWEKGLKPMQSMGSALTYARRYGLSAMVGTCPEDDDGNGSHGSGQNGRSAPRENAGTRHEEQGKRSGNQDSAPRQSSGSRAGSRGAPVTRSPAKDQPAYIKDALDRWHAFDPIQDAKDEAQRSGRLLNGLITAAIEADLIDPEKVQDPGAAGKAPTRNIPQCHRALEWLQSKHAEWFRNAIDVYLDAKQTSMEAAAVDAADGVAPANASAEMALAN